MFEKILVPLGDSPHTETALDNACQLALKFDSEVVCLYVVDTEKIQSAYLTSAQIPEVMMSMEPMYETNIIQAVQRDLEKEENNAHECFEKYKEKYPRANLKYEDASGIVYEEILKREKDYDLVVMGKSVHSEENEPGVLGDNFRKIIHKSDLPVLASTYGHEIGDNLMVCYDGKKNSKKALDVAIGVAKKFDVPLNILTINEEEKIARKVNSDAVEKALLHNVVPVSNLQWLNTVGTIIAEIDHLNINFLFMGAYGDNPIKDLILGSTTDQVVSETGCPILLYR